jgi:2-iminobutanoate/2-iminopropanoate deaminase
MNHIKEIKTEGAPRPIGPYSQATAGGGLLFVSGQIAIDPTTGGLVPGGIREQAEMTMKNIAAILAAAGASLADVIKTEIFMKNLKDFKEMNEIYAARFSGEPRPARTTVEVKGLPKNALLEISCIARLNDK